MFRKKAYLLIVISLVSIGGISQHITSVGISNYGTAQSQFISPSLSGYSPYNWHVNLAGLWFNFNNNYISLNAPYSLYRIPNRVPKAYQTENGDPAFEKYWLTEHHNGRRKNISVSSAIYGPSASVKIKRARIGFFTQGYAGMRLVGVSENLAHAAYQEMDSSKGAFLYFNSFSSGKPNKVDQITAAATNFAAIGVNSSYSIPLQWNRQLIIGFSMKRAFGFNGYHYNYEKFEVISNQVDSIYILPTSMQLSQYGQNETGKGWGYDIGATYVFNRKDFKRNGVYAERATKYYSKFSIAIMDIGAIKYNNAEITKITINNTLGFNVDSFDIEINENNYQSVLDTLLGVYGDASTTRSKINIGLPTRLVVSFDRQVRRSLFISGTLSQSLRKRHSPHNHFQSTLLIAPRLEYPYFEVATPIVIGYDYRAIRLGTNFRLGPLYLGSNSVLPFVHTRQWRDLDFFVGIAFGNIPNYNLLSWLEGKEKRRKARKKAKACPAF